MPLTPRKILVSSALPYANGSIHLGHLVEYIHTDIWVRFQKLREHECSFVCATDAHGTPTMLRARQEGVSPEALVESIAAEHERDLRAFGVNFDNYTTTHCAENQELVNDIYQKLKDAGHIYTKTINQAYDEQENMFLPDRFVKGTCPHCGTADQYGDACESCGQTYSPHDLKDAISVVSNTAPAYRDSEHYFFKLSRFDDFLKSWMERSKLDTGIRNKLTEWFETGLSDWDISRDSPYFGFKIPGTEDKFFYVWLDAPVGYLASFAQLAQRQSIAFSDYWAADSDAEVYHFIGKDIVYFHALFWPAVLHGAGYRTPTSVFAHGFLLVNGEKMSKSRGTFINGRTYLDHLNPNYLRFYYAAKLNSGIDDIDMNLDDFVARVNSDVVGKFVNLASRNAGFISKRFDGRLAASMHDADLYQQFVDAGESIAEAYESREFSQAIRKIMALADRANQYVDQHKPWVMIKDPDQLANVQSVSSQALNLFRVLAIYLEPVLPELGQKIREFFNENQWTWSSVAKPLLDSDIQRYKPLITRIEPEKIDAMVEASKQGTEESNSAAAESDDLIDIDSFLNVDLRVARIVEASAVEGADKLLRLTLDVGDLGTRQVFAGIKHAYEPSQLENRLAVLVANLAPRKMRFGLSEGMILAASDGDKVQLIEPEAGSTPGSRVR